MNGLFGHFSFHIRKKKTPISKKKRKNKVQILKSSCYRQTICLSSKSVKIPFAVLLSPLITSMNQL